MIIQNQAELTSEDSAFEVKFWAGRKIRHPQIIYEGLFKGLGRPGLQPPAPQRSRFITFGAEEPVDSPQRGQSLTGFSPALVEYRQGDLGILTYLAQEPLQHYR